MISFYYWNFVLEIGLLPTVLIAFWKCWDLIKQTDSYELQEEQQEEPTKHVISYNILQGTIHFDYDNEYVTIKNRTLNSILKFDRIFRVSRDAEKIGDSIVETFNIQYDIIGDYGNWTENNIIEYSISLLPTDTESPIENKKREKTNREIGNKLFYFNRKFIGTEERYKSMDANDYNFALDITTTPLQTKTSR